MSELICNFHFSEHPLHIPNWALGYLLTKPLQEILGSAAARTKNNIIPCDAEFCALRGVDIGRILRRRWIEDSSDDCDSYHLMVLSLYLDEHQSVVPVIMIEAFYTSTQSKTEKGCFMEAQWPQRMDESRTIILSTCTMFAIDRETGQRLHLRSSLPIVPLSRTVTATSGEGGAFQDQLGEHEGNVARNAPSDRVYISASSRFTCSQS